MSSHSFLQARDLVKVYGDRRVLDGVSLTASPGQRIGLIGENGVGKSTLLRLLAGVEAAGSGEVTRPADIGFGHQRFVATVTAPAAEGMALAVRDVAVPGRLAVDELDLPADGRLLITGANGAGKSTLLAVLVGRLGPAQGTVHRRSGVRIGLLEQDVTFADAHRTPRSVYRRAVGGSAVPLVELGLIAPADLDRPVGALSVGQRRRLALALLVADTPHVLLLDEPTNHLSLALVEELEEALRAAPGAVVAASHDRWLRRRWDGAELCLQAAS